MTRLIIPALVALLVGVLVSGQVIAAELKEKPSGIPVLWVGDGKSFDTAIFFISARSQAQEDMTSNTDIYRAANGLIKQPRVAMRTSNPNWRRV